MRWTWGLVFLIAIMAGVSVSKEHAFSGASTVGYNVVLGLERGLKDGWNRLRFR